MRRLWLTPLFVFSLFGDDLEFAFLCDNFGCRTFCFFGGKLMPYSIEKYYEMTADYINCIKDDRMRAGGYIRRVFLFLRKNLHLLAAPDYNRLYEDCIDYLIIDARINQGWTEYEPSGQRDLIELLGDLENRSKCETSYDTSLTREEVDFYLNHRRAIGMI